MRNNNSEQHKRNMQLALCSVRVLRVIAKDPFSTPVEKRLATWHANRKEGLVQTEPTPKQRRARILGQINYYMQGSLGQGKRLCYEIAKLDTYNTDMSARELYDLRVSVTNAINDMTIAIILAKQISDKHRQKIIKKEKQNEQL